jgi:carboxyl-terminal processing protease
MNTPRMLRRLPAVLFGLALSACGGGSSSGGPIANNCSIPAQNQAVYNTMQRWYYWYRELPVVNPASFPSPQALLDALMFEPLDRFSYLTTQAEEDALFGDSQFVGVGFRSIEADGVQVVNDVYEGAPADRAGLVRGSRILAVDGVPIAEVLADPDGFVGAIGPREIGYTFSLTFVNPDGQEYTRTLAKEVVTIPPVTATRVFDVNGVTTGYFVFRNFVEPGVNALNQAFTEFHSAGVTQLIVDLRYNGGGLVSVLERLADLIGSRTAPGMPFASYRYNDKNTNRNETFYLASNPPANALALDKLVFITTPSTASASEMLVNGMPPYINTATIGQETYGKPVGQLGFRFCEQVLRPVSFETVNGLGAGGYFEGIPADCPAADTLSVPFGVAGEQSFDAAVHWLEHGFCAPLPEPLAAALEFEPVRKPPHDRPRYQPNDAH